METQLKRALLIGNGVNLLDISQSFSWDKLLKEINTTNKTNIDFDNPFKPFPLAFDQLQHSANGDIDIKQHLKYLKVTIQKAFNENIKDKKGYNEYHKQIINKGYDDILTTNYEYSLELSCINDFWKIKKTKLSLNNQEQNHSLKRGYLINKMRIWHIHGELCDNREHNKSTKTYPEQSILIGYEQYAEYQKIIQDKIKGNNTDRKDTLVTRLQKQEYTSPYWMDILFTHNVDIIGQGLDFCENHLWWLIKQRANMIKTNSKLFRNNTIRFFYPAFEIDPNWKINEESDKDEIYKKRNLANKTKAIIDLLAAFNVAAIALNGADYNATYDNFILNY